jgi:hypothetical protein
VNCHYAECRYVACRGAIAPDASEDLSGLAFRLKKELWLQLQKSPLNLLKPEVAKLEMAKPEVAKPEVIFIDPVTKLYSFSAYVNLCKIVCLSALGPML